jgi:hypothetical protein
VVPNDLCDQREAEPAPGLLGGYEWIEQVRKQILRYAGTVVLDAKFQRQRNPRFLARKGKVQAWAECGRELDFPLFSEIGDGFGGIFD